MRENFLHPLQSPVRITLVAFLLRVAWLLYKITQIPAQALATVPFQNEVGNVAYALSTGHGFCCLFRQPTGPTAWLAPVYPLLIAAIFKLFGAFTFRAFCSAAILNSTASALAAVPLFHAAKRIAGTTTAAIAAWLWAISPVAIIIPFAWVWDTSLSTLLAAALLWATLRIHDQPTMRNAALYGVLWAISLLTNPALGALLPFLVVWAALTPNSEHASHENCHPEERVVCATKDFNHSVLPPSPPQRGHFPFLLFHFPNFLRSLLLSATVILAICLPWSIRNYTHFHRFIPLRSNFPYELWSGNNEIFDPESRAINRITRYEQATLYAREGESVFLDEKWQAAKTFIRTHPKLYAQLCGQRIVATWFGTDSPINDFRHTDSALAQLLLAWNALIFAAMLVGLLRLYIRQRPYFYLMAICPVIFPITFYLAHTSLRHRHPIDPVLILLVAIAITGTKPSSPNHAVLSRDNNALSS
jgi:hypothetical protein